MKNKSLRIAFLVALPFVVTTAVAAFMLFLGGVLLGYSIESMRPLIAIASIAVFISSGLVSSVGVSTAIGVKF